MTLRPEESFVDFLRLGAGQVFVWLGVWLNRFCQCILRVSGRLTEVGYILWKDDDLLRQLRRIHGWEKED